MDPQAATTTVPGSDRGLGQDLLALEPQFRERVWGGQRLRASKPPTGEAWVAYGESIVARGPLAGRKLADLATENGPALLGSSVCGRYGHRFPLLAKILDCADWLSVQVHPNDEQAGRLVEPGTFGKAEAWFFLEAAPEARILLGVRPGTTAAALKAAIREGRVMEVAAEVSVRSCQAVLIPAGTLHAVGPGLLLYEIQQNSDITYRAYDWGRPQSSGRRLHIEEAVQVTTTEGPRELALPTVAGATGTARAVECEHFELDLARVGATPLSLDTKGRSFHFLTAVEGPAVLETAAESVTLQRLETALVAGATGAYSVRAAKGSATLLKASVPV
ncbi:MAG: type I phosphomannose isomerase catalytic subunit [Candidatus Limnocylindrales bacterium]